MKSAEEALEFSRIEGQLDEYFAMEENVSSFHGEKMMTSPDELHSEHEYLLEACSFFQKGGNLQLLKVPPLLEELAILSKGGILTIKGLSDFIPFLDNVASFLSHKSEVSSLELLNGIFETLKDFSWIKSRLSSAILPDLTLADDASENLYVIRVKLRKLQASLGDVLKKAAGKYSQYLADVPETVKSGMPVLAVRSDLKGHVPGMVADISNTGSTSFVVPVEIMDIQNKITVLKDEEQQEIEKIIKELTGLLKGSYDDIHQAYVASLRLDSLFNRVRFGLSYGGCVAEDGGEIHLEDLAHPLLKADKVVRNNISLGGDKAKILVISGPNAGGKTVLIKALALAVLMNQRGLLIDALGKAVLPAFSDIFFLAGDSQSIMDSLSTFSGHITAIKEGLEKVTSSSLFIVDEIGQGTSPRDGEAIGVAVIDYLKKIGCFSVLTSHYDGIKQKAFNDPSCLIGAMVFDEKDITPTFAYKEGMIGKSYALEVSSNLGLSPEIIKEAQEYVEKKNEEDGKKEIEKAIALQQQTLAIKEEYEKKMAAVEELSLKRERALKALADEKDSIYLKAEEKVDRLVQEKLEELEIAYKEHKISLKDMAELKNQVKGLYIKNKNHPAKEEDAIERHVFKPGDRVMINSLMNSGTIVKFDEKKGSAVIDLGGMEVSTTESDLNYLGAAPKKAPEVKIRDSYILKKTGVPLEVNLIGLRQDEAREKLDKYLDDCLLVHFHQIRIIHGNGTGALRTMVQNYLKKNDNVKSFRFGYGGEGGVGVTVVTLK